MVNTLWVEKELHTKGQDGACWVELLALLLFVKQLSDRKSTEFKLVVDWYGFSVPLVDI